MIKAGIIGGSNPMAGELIRLLINHPDVEIMWVDSARYTGRLVSDVHHGLLGDTQLRITPAGANQVTDIDVLFIFRHKGQTEEWLRQHSLPGALRIVDLSVDMRSPELASAYGYVYGLPELNRKAMVRGATRAIVPHPVANIAALSLLPLAKRGFLPLQASVSVSVPADAEQVERGSEVASEAATALQSVSATPIQLMMVAGPADDARALSATVEFESDLDLGQVMRFFEEDYDDHSFTFVVNEQPTAKEVVGTNKCLMRIDKRGGVFTITAVMDAMLKGAAGTAVHDMNLLFGLHEKVGLALKASTY